MEPNSRSLATLNQGSGFENAISWVRTSLKYDLLFKVGQM